MCHRRSFPPRLILLTLKKLLT
eukprot:COSAG02_NODE_25572_length_654_cov_2.145946_2_plen_21_part_01